MKQWRCKGHEKCIFETPHNECQRIKFQMNVKESNFNEKKDHNFHISLLSGPRWLNPPSLPYGKPDRKISVFLTPRLRALSKRLSTKEDLERPLRAEVKKN